MLTYTSGLTRENTRIWKAIPSGDGCHLDAFEFAVGRHDPKIEAHLCSWQMGLEATCFSGEPAVLEDWARLCLSLYCINPGQWQNSSCVSLLFPCRLASALQNHAALCGSLIHVLTVFYTCSSKVRSITSNVGWNCCGATRHIHAHTHIYTHNIHTHDPTTYLNDSSNQWRFTGLQETMLCKREHLQQTVFMCCAATLNLQSKNMQWMSSRRNSSALKASWNAMKKKWPPSN